MLIDVCMILLLPVVKVVLTSAVVKFQCGRDLCVANERYCDHQDSDDPQSWTCTPCEEERSRCPTLSVHPHCYGFCQKLKIEAMYLQHQEKMETMALELQEAEEKWNKSVSDIMLQWKTSNITYEQQLATSQHDSDHSRLIIKYLIPATTALAVALLCCIVYCCYRRQRKSDKGSFFSLASSDKDNTDANQPLQVVTSPNGSTSD